MKTFIKECRWGKFILLHGDMISQYVNMYGEWSETEVDLFRKLVSPHGNVIEVGSNIGMHAIPISLACPGGRVFCYEPQRPIFHILCGNVAINNRLNVVVRNVAVGDAPGWVQIATSSYDQPWNYGAFSVTQGFNSEGKYGSAVESVNVELVTLDTEPALAALDTLDLLKIDAEGFEPAVLAGARKLIERHRPYIFVEANAESVVQKILDSLRSHDYVGYWFVNNRFRTDNYNQSVFRVPGCDFNIIFTHRKKPLPLAEGLRPVRNFNDLRQNIVPILDRFG